MRVYCGHEDKQTKTMKISNFVIFAEPRTGSTLLKTILNHQKKILCLGELFNKKRADRISKKIFTKRQKPLLNFLGKDQSKWYDKINKDFNIYLNIISEQSKKEIFGYKIFNTHIKNFSNYNPNSRFIYLNSLKESNAKVIILQRKNVLLRYISNMTAQSIGLYTSMINKKDSETKVYKLNPIKIDYNSYIRYNKKNKREYAQKLKDVKEYDLPYVHITYEDFTGENFIESFKKIFNLLDLDFNNFIDLRNDDGTIVNHKKINVYNLQDKIINYEAFKKEAEINNDAETLRFLE